MEWYMKAANQEHTRAQYCIGLIYQDVKYESHDYDKALEWYLKAAKQGDSRSLHSIGLMIMHGEGVCHEAVEWYLKATGESGISPSAAAPRTSLFFQKNDPVLRTALARSVMAIAQEKYSSGIDDIAFDDVTPGSPKAKAAVLVRPGGQTAGASGSLLSVSSPVTSGGTRSRSQSQQSGQIKTRPRSDSGAKRTFFSKP